MHEICTSLWDNTMWCFSTVFLTVISLPDFISDDGGLIKWNENYFILFDFFLSLILCLVLVLCKSLCKIGIIGIIFDINEPGVFFVGKF